MNEPDVTPPEAAPAPVEPAPVDPAPAAPERHQGHGLAYAVIVIFLLGMAFGVWGLWQVFAPDPADPAAQLAQQRERLATLEQQVATLTRSDQVSRNANTALQGTLAERDEEISALKADVAFYERFVGATAQRRGLSVHDLDLKPQDAQTWHFVATLTQNLTRGAVNAGTVTLALEGTRDGRLQQLDWQALRQQPDAPGVDYSFKYFQRIEGDILLPAGLKPVRVVVRVQPRGGKAVEQSFTWADATATQGAGER